MRGCSAEASSSAAKGVSATAAASAGGVVDASTAEAREARAAVADKALQLSVAGSEYEALARALVVYPSSLPPQGATQLT